MVVKRTPQETGIPLNRRRLVRSSGSVHREPCAYKQRSKGANRNASPVHQPVNSRVLMFPSHCMQAQKALCRNGQSVSSPLLQISYGRLLVRIHDLGWWSILLKKQINESLEYPARGSPEGTEGEESFKIIVSWDSYPDVNRNEHQIECRRTSPAKPWRQERQ